VDFSHALRLALDDASAYYERGAVYKQRGETHAVIVGFHRVVVLRHAV